MTTNYLAAYYPFNDNFFNYADTLLNPSTGTVIIDLSANNGASIDNTIYKIENGSLSLQAASSQFMKVNNYVITQILGSSINGLSISLWIRAKNTNSVIFDFNTETTSAGNVMLRINTTGNLVASVSNTSVPGGSITSNVWVHIVWTLSYSTSIPSISTYRIYTNGVLTFTSAANNNFPATTSTARNFSYIGKSDIAGYNTFDGNIDEFRIYQKTLTADEVSSIYNYTGPPVVPCFREGTKILCFEDNEEIYLPIEEIREGTLVKTLMNSYVPVYKIGKKIIQNTDENIRSPNQLYVCTQSNYPEIFEDLYITGHHSILVKELTEKQRNEIENRYKRIFVTSQRYRLMAFLDDRAQIFRKKGDFLIYHFALENENPTWNYGVYANGLLVESCSKEYIDVYSGMEIVD